MSKPLATIIGPSPELSWDERRQLHREWYERTLRGLLHDTSFERELAELTIGLVVEKFGDDDKLSALMRKKLTSARKGKPRGGRNTWDYGRYYRLLRHYHFQKLWVGRSKALEVLARLEGLRGDNKENKLASRITEARKVVPRAEQREIARLLPTKSPQK